MKVQKLQAYRQYLLDVRGLRPSTVNNRLSALSAFARFLMGKGLLQYNPLDLVERVRDDGTIRQRDWSSWDAVQALRREMNKDLLKFSARVIIEFLYTGMTLKELTSLPWEREGARDYLMVDGRKVRLHPEARLAMDHHSIVRPLQMGDRLIVGRGPGWSLKPQRVYSLLRRLSSKIDVRVGIRDLRLIRWAMAEGVIAPTAGQETIAA